LKLASAESSLAQPKLKILIWNILRGASNRVPLNGFAIRINAAGLDLYGVQRIAPLADQVEAGLPEDWGGDVEAFACQGQRSHRLGCCAISHHRGRRSIWYSRSATVLSAALVNSGAACAAWGNCGWLVNVSTGLLGLGR
jgi:hypothetical protein